jgi:hypothetical protein
MVVDLAVTPGDKAVCVRIAGDVDVFGEPELAGVVGQLAATRCGSVYIDLAGVHLRRRHSRQLPFRLPARLPGHASMVLCRPDAVRADLPPDWIAPPAPTDGPVVTPTSAAA